MKDIQQITRQGGTFIKKHSSDILSGIAVVGVIASIVMAIAETPKALKHLEDAKKKNDALSDIDIFKAVAPIYIPTAVICLSTITCILSANILNKKQQSSIIGAYIFLEDTFKKYRNAANKVYGNDADTKIKTEIAKTTYVSHDGYLVYNPDMDFESERLLFYDFYSQRYFNATLTAVINAQYHLNRNLTLRGYVTVNEFYEFIGIGSIKDGDEIGWNMDYLMTCGLLWLDFENRYTKLEDRMECCIVSPYLEPLPFSVMEREL